jgi:hypothetical protein
VLGLILGLGFRGPERGRRITPHSCPLGQERGGPKLNGAKRKRSAHATGSILGAKPPRPENPGYPLSVAPEREFLQVYRKKPEGLEGGSPAFRAGPG